MKIIIARNPRFFIHFTMTKKGWATRLERDFFRAALGSALKGAASRPSLL
jgi:hypothetical protein